MNFFQQLEQQLKGCKRVRIDVTPKGDKLTVVFYPEMNNETVAEKLLPLTLTGTATELDEAFFKHTSRQIDTANSVQSNVEAVESEVKKAEDEAKKDSAKSKTKSTAKPTAKKVEQKVEEKTKPVDEGPKQQGIEF